MKVTRKDLQNRYATLSTEELLNIYNEGSLTEMAMQFIQEELHNRDQALPEYKTKESSNENLQEFHFTKDLTSLTKFLKTMLWISLGISVLSLLSDFMQMNLLSSGSFSQAQAESNDARQQIMGFLYLGAFIVTGVAFLKWIYRANSNCHGFGTQRMEFSPGWSIGYYFIPFVNLYKPYRAMKGLGMGSSLRLTLAQN